MNPKLPDKKFELLATKNKIRCIISMMFKKKKIINLKEYEFINNEIKKKSNFFENLLYMINNLKNKSNKIIEKIILVELRLNKKKRFDEGCFYNDNNISTSTYNYNNILINSSESSRESSPVGDSLLKAKIFRDIAHSRKERSLKSFAFNLKKC